MNVAVCPFIPRVGEVQELKLEVCTLRRKNSGGNEVLQEVSLLSSVEPLPVRERKLRLKAPLIDCPHKGKHVLNDRAGHPVIFYSVKLLITWQHQEKASKLLHGGKWSTTRSLMAARTRKVDRRGRQFRHRRLVWPCLSLSLRDRGLQCHHREVEHGLSAAELYQ